MKKIKQSDEAVEELFVRLKKLLFDYGARLKHLKSQMKLHPQLKKVIILDIKKTRSKIAKLKKSIKLYRAFYKDFNKNLDMSLP